MVEISDSPEETLEELHITEEGDEERTKSKDSTDTALAATGQPASLSDIEIKQPETADSGMAVTEGFTRHMTTVQESATQESPVQETITSKVICSKEKQVVASDDGSSAKMITTTTSSVTEGPKHDAEHTETDVATEIVEIATAAGIKEAINKITEQSDRPTEDAIPPLSKTSPEHQHTDDETPVTGAEMVQTKEQSVELAVEIQPQDRQPQLEENQAKSEEIQPQIQESQTREEQHECIMEESLHQAEESRPESQVELMMEENLPRSKDGPSDAENMEVKQHDDQIVLQSSEEIPSAEVEEAEPGVVNDMPADINPDESDGIPVQPENEIEQPQATEEQHEQSEKKATPDCVELAAEKGQKEDVNSVTQNDGRQTSNEDCSQAAGASDSHHLADTEHDQSLEGNRQSSGAAAAAASELGTESGSRQGTDGSMAT